MIKYHQKLSFLLSSLVFLNLLNLIKLFLKIDNGKIMGDHLLIFKNGFRELKKKNLI